MKWLLITNIHNPGDIWVRLGVEHLIRHLDSKPTFILSERDAINPESPSSICGPSRPEFDYSVVCGMPVLWSHKNGDGKSVNTTTNHGAWDALNGWASAKKKMIVCGFGIYLPCKDTPQDYTIADPSTVPALKKFFGRCRLVYSRSPLAAKIFDGMPFLPCPSVLIVPQRPERDLRLCNFMPGGGHYPYISPAKSRSMQEKMGGLAKQLLMNGFDFMAHNQVEAQLARNLGWSKLRIHTWNESGQKPLIDLYARCQKYIGNRIHGGIVSRAAGADTVVIGYDTRLAAVELLGGKAYTPERIPDLTGFIESPPAAEPFDVDAARKAHLKLWATVL